MKTSNNIEVYEEYEYAKLYDSHYNSMNHDIEFWRRVCSNRKEILEIGCGTGRITRRIIKNNNKVTALDLSVHMLNLLKNNIENKNGIEIIEGDMLNLNLGKSFDIIIIPANSLNHIYTSENFLTVLENFFLHLNDNGLVVFDMINPKFDFLLHNVDEKYNFSIIDHENVKYKTWETSYYNYKNQCNYISHFYELNKERKLIRTDMKVRLYFPAELDHLISLSKFYVKAKLGWYDGRKFDGNSREQIYILRKKSY